MCLSDSKTYTLIIRAGIPPYVEHPLNRIFCKSKSDSILDEQESCQGLVFFSTLTCILLWGNAKEHPGRYTGLGGKQVPYGHGASAWTDRTRLVLTYPSLQTIRT